MTAKINKMTATQKEIPELRENGVQQTGIIARIKNIWEYRDLLVNISRRELKVRYKDSIIGFFWSLLNPLLYLAIFSVVFGFIIRNADIQYFAIFLLCGLLPYNLFSMGLTGATTSITGNGPLIQKVWFPREILPIASILSNLVTFFLQMIIIVVALAIFRLSPKWDMLWLLIPALIITLALAIGIGLILSAVNVYFRDVQHFLELGLLVLFWFTPIVYPYSFVANSLPQDTIFGDRLGMLNPITPIVTIFRRVLYNPENFERVNGDKSIPEEGDWVFDILLRPASWHLTNLIIPAVTAVVFLYLGFKIFAKLEANLGEEL